MSQHAAQKLVRRLATDPIFRDALKGVAPAGRRAFLKENGFEGAIDSQIVNAFRLGYSCGSDESIEAGGGEIVAAMATHFVTLPGIHSSSIF